MLAQKEVDIKNTKLETESKIKEVTQQLEKSMNAKEIENQKQQEKIEHLTKIVEVNPEMKAMLNVTLVGD